MMGEMAEDYQVNKRYSVSSIDALNKRFCVPSRTVRFNHKLKIACVTSFIPLLEGNPGQSETPYLQASPF